MLARTGRTLGYGVAVGGLVVVATTLVTCTQRHDVAQETTVRALKGAGAPPNFTIGPPHYENTAAVAPPSTTCPLGTIMVNLGGDGIYTRPIYKSDGTIDTTPNLPLTAWPKAPSTNVGVDDNIVRLNDGTFLAEAHGGIWSAFPGTPPAWANEFISGQIGARWAAHFVKGDSCGANWQVSTPLDIAALRDGRYALPRPSTNPDANDIPQTADVACTCTPDHPVCQTNDSHGRPLWWIGGGDRPEVYNDPYTGNVYMTFHGASGPYCPVADGPAFWYGVVLVSRDKGQTWEFVAEIANVPPMVMTSTPDGRLYLAALNWTEVWLYYTKPTAPGQIPEFVAPPTSPCGLDACPFIVNQLDTMGVPIPNELGVGEDIHRFENNIQISRISNDRASSKVRVAYQGRNPVSGMQQQRVVRVEIPPEGGLPLVKPVTLVDAFDPQDHSVIYFNFNDSDVPSTPAGTKSNTSMAYWYEAPRCREGELQDGTRRCHDVNRDSSKCGPASTVCAAGQVCSAGSCVASCPAGTTQCAAPWPGGVGCYDTTSSTRNCGACGNTCAFGQKCVAGACVAGTGKPAYGLRHMFFDGDCRVSRPRFLSVDASGATRNFEGTNLAPGDYQKGASFWKGSQLNYFAQWSEFDALYGAVTTSPFSSSLGDQHAWTHDRTQADFTPWDTMVRGDGWKTVDLRSFVAPSGEILVDGVWHKQSAATTWIEGYLYSDYLTALANFKSQGYRLEKLQSFPLNDGTFRVDALFQQNANVDNALAAQGYLPTDFAALDAARTALGDRLDHIGSWIVSDGTVRVDGVWHHDPGASYFVQGYTVEDFKTVNTERAAAGYRLDELASFYIPGQGVRVDALWHQGTEEYRWVQGYAIDDFRSVESDLRCEGFRLEKVSSFVIPGEDGGVRMDGVWHRAVTAAPTALCQDVSVQAGPTCSASVTVDMIDNGSIDASGGAPALSLSATTFTGKGPHAVTLTATSGGLSSSCTATVTIVDVTPPTITAPPPVSTTQCLGSATVALGSPTVADNCVNPPAITGRVVSVNGVPVTSPPFTGSSTTLGVGTSVIEWTASDGTNNATATQTVSVGARIESSFSFLVDDRAHVNGPGTSLAAIANAGTGTTRVGYDAFTGGITSVSGATVFDRATIGGNILSAGMNNVSSKANVSGTVTNFGSVSLPALPTLPSFPSPTGGSLTVNSGSFTRGPGSYDTFQLNGGTLTLTGAGDYFFRTLSINSAATIRVAANARVFVQNSFTYRSRFLMPTGTNTQTVYLGYAGGTSVSMEAVFNGTLVAPAAAVSFGTGSGLTFTGSFFARTIEVQPASTLVCQ